MVCLMKPRFYEQMQKRCALYSIEGWYETWASFMKEYLTGQKTTRWNFTGHFLHVPGPNVIVGGLFTDYGDSRNEKGFMDSRQMWFNRRCGPASDFNPIKSTFHRNGEIWRGEYDYGKYPTEAKTELIADGPYSELSEKYKDIIDAFKLQLPESKNLN